MLQIGVFHNLNICPRGVTKHAFNDQAKRAIRTYGVHVRIQAPSVPEKETSSAKIHFGAPVSPTVQIRIQPILCGDHQVTDHSIPI